MIAYKVITKPKEDGFYWPIEKETWPHVLWILGKVLTNLSIISSPLASGMEDMETLRVITATLADAKEWERALSGTTDSVIIEKLEDYKLPII